MDLGTVKGLGLHLGNHFGYIMKRKLKAVMINNWT